MKNSMIMFLFGITLSLSLATQSAFAVLGTPGTPLPLLVQQQLNQTAFAAPIVKLGTQITQKKLNVMKAVYDVAVLGGASGASIVLKDAAGGDAVIPKGAIIKSVMIDQTTGFSGLGGTLVSFGINTVSDLKTATAIASYTQIVAGTPVGTAATAVRVLPNYNRPVVANVTVHTVTAGKAVLYIEYYVDQ